MVAVKGVRGPSGEFGALGRVDVAGSAADLWRFVADVEQQPEWNHGVKQSRVLERKGNCKSVHQVLSWNFLALRGDMHLRLRQEEDPRALTISTELDSGTMMRHFRSRVRVRDQSPGVCELEMEMYMAPNIYVPFGIRHMVSGQVRRQLRGVLASLQTKFEERQGGKLPRAGRAGSEQQQPGRGGGGGGNHQFGLPDPFAEARRWWQQQLQQQAPWWATPGLVAAA